MTLENNLLRKHSVEQQFSKNIEQRVQKYQDVFGRQLLTNERYDFSITFYNQTFVSLKYTSYAQ